MLFLGDGATIFRIPLLNILVLGKSSSRRIRTCWLPGTLSIWWERNGTFICNIFLDHIKRIDPPSFLMNIHKKWSLPYHTYRINNHKLLSQIFSVTTRVCPHQISMQHMINHHSAQAVAHHLRSIKLLLKKNQYFYKIQ